MASLSLIFHTADPLYQGSTDTTARPGPDLTGPRSPPSSQPGGPSPYGLDAPWLTPQEEFCSRDVQNVLWNSRKSSPKYTYFLKWKRFSLWSRQKGVSLFQSPIQHVLDYLLYLQQQILAISSIRVHLVALSSFWCPIGNRLLLCSPMSLGFLKDLDHLYPQADDLIPPLGFKPGSTLWTTICYFICQWK